MQRIGYLAASQCFHEELDVLMLTTNLVKKVLSHIQHVLPFMKFVIQAKFFDEIEGNFV